MEFEDSTPISTAEAEAETGTAANKPKISLTKLRKMTVLELKTELRNLGLDTEGLRGALHDRLKLALFPVTSTPASGNSGQSLDFQKSGPVLKRIPKGSRMKIAKAFTQILEKYHQ